MAAARADGVVLCGAQGGTARHTVDSSPRALLALMAPAAESQGPSVPHRRLPATGQPSVPRTRCVHCPTCVLTHVQAWYLFFFSSLVCIAPYINVLLRSRGLGDHQIGTISGLRPWLASVASFGWSALADHYRLHRCVPVCMCSARICVHVCVPGEGGGAGFGSASSAAASALVRRGLGEASNTALPGANEAGL